MTMASWAPAGLRPEPARAADRHQGGDGEGGRTESGAEARGGDGRCHLSIIGQNARRSFAAAPARTTMGPWRHPSDPADRGARGARRHRRRASTCSSIRRSWRATRSTGPAGSGGRHRPWSGPPTPPRWPRCSPLCDAERIAVVPQGGNTGLVGGGVPLHGELVLSLRRLDSPRAGRRGGRPGHRRGRCHPRRAPGPRGAPRPRLRGRPGGPGLGHGRRHGGHQRRAGCTCCGGGAPAVSSWASRPSPPTVGCCATSTAW